MKQDKGEKAFETACEITVSIVNEMRRLTEETFPK